MLAGCRKESDSLVSYAFNENIAFAQADSSFAAKFDILWKGLNANYAMWDFEKENGLDWDAVYEEFYPRFAALDKEKFVSDKAFRALIEELVSPLHDGHLAVFMKNHHTGTRVVAQPGRLRIEKDKVRGPENEAQESFIPSLKYYQDKGEILEYREVSSNPYLSVLKSVTESVNETLSKVTDPDTQAALKALQEELKSSKEYFDNEQASEAVNLYNEAVIRYEYLKIPGFESIESALVNNPVIMKYALFKGNIAYISLKAFNLTPYLDEQSRDETFPTYTERTKAQILEVIATWKAWFDAIQAHHKAGDLGGVIIDMRSNEGGFATDFRYMVGALVPSGGLHYANARFKRGPGRYDYSPVMPQPMETMKAEHAVVDKPIVVLCNCTTVSMGEHTTWGVKSLPNGTVIGTRTWGGLSALNSNEDYSDSYAGTIGVENVTPVFAYVPIEVVMTQDGKILEGYGIEPDIELAFDMDKWNDGAGPDNQLDRALQHIRN